MNKVLRPLQCLVEVQCVGRPQLASQVTTVFESEKESVDYVSIYIYIMYEGEARKTKFNEGIDAIEEDSHTTV